MASFNIQLTGRDLQLLSMKYQATAKVNIDFLAMIKVSDWLSVLLCGPE